MKKILLLFVAFATMFMFNGIVKASDVAAPNIIINSPKVNQIYYKGENINYNVIDKVYWDDVGIWPSIEIVRIDKKETHDYDSSHHHSYKRLYGKNNWKFTDSFKSKDLKLGKYKFYICNYSTTNESYKFIGDYGTEYKMATRTFYLKELKSPTRIKLKAKKKKIKITFNKVEGASKYYIYRSTNKKRGFKKIASVSNLSYTNKKLKRHKKYYYKIKSVRKVNNTVKSSYSKVVSVKTK